jgi:hypothetical protein
MNDWIGLVFYLLLVVGIIVGLKILAKPRTTTGEEFERNVSESGSMLSASINALNEVLDPAAARSKDVQTQLKEGRFKKKEREENADGTDILR